MGNPCPLHTCNLADKCPTDHFIIDASERTGRCTADLCFRNPEQTLQIRDGSYPLHMAIASGATPSVVRILLQEAPAVARFTDKCRRTPLHVALEVRAPPDVVRLMLSADAGVASISENTRKNLPLHVACIHGCCVKVAKGYYEFLSPCYTCSK